MATTVLIADGEPVLREGLAELLGSQADFVVVGEASNTRDAIAEARARRPDIALLAFNLPVGGGVEAAARIRELCPTTRLIVMVPPRSESAPAGAADAVVSYATRADQLIASIRAARWGAPMLPSNPSASPGPGLRRLTPREAQVCALLGRAYSNREIQEELGIRNSAVKRHVRSILFKLGAHNRIEVAIQLARGSDWLPQGGPP